MQFKQRKLVLSILGLSLILVIGACNKEEAKETSVIEMGQINWEENIAVTHMWKHILEAEGYEVNFHLLDAGTIMAALANDELDINLETWLPIQDKFYYEEYADKINFSEETWYDTAKVGLVVPSYLEEINSIEDLNEHKDLFNQQITGFEPGAGTMEITEVLLKEYALDYELIASSEPAMLTEIKQAMDKQEAIVAPLWNPHRIFSELDLKYLDDPKKVYGDVEKIHHVTRLGFEDDFPEVSRWIKNWKMSDDEISELMADVAAAESPDEGVKKWLSANESLVQTWLDS